jgi:hypothetical protein
MAIKTGIGVGAAQVFDTSGIMNAYGRQIAQQQRAEAVQAQREYLSAEKEKERAEREAARFDENIADIMASAKTSGARDVDVPDITKSYNDIKDFYSKSGSLKDSDKPLFRAELRNKINSLNEYAQRSEKLSKDALAISSEIARNEWDYNPESVADINDILKTPLSKLGARANLDPQRYKRLPNFGLIDTIIDSTYEKGNENAKFAGEVFDKGKRFNVKRIEPAFIQNNLVQRFTSSPEALKAISSLYVRELGKQPTNEELTNYIMDKYKTKHKFDYISEARDLKEPKDSETIYSSPIELNIPFAQETKTPGIVNVQDYVKLPMAKQNFAGSGYIDMATGSPSTSVLDSSNDYEVVGVGNFPFIRKGAGANKSLEGSLAQPDFVKKNPSAVQKIPMIHVQKITDGNVENLLIPFDRLPPSAKTKKGLVNFTPAGKITSTQEAAIARGLKDNPGATRAQIIKALGL